MPVLADRSARWTDFGKRIASALILAPLGLAGLWIGGVVFQLLIAIIALGLLLEWIGLCGERTRSVGGMLVIAGLLAALICAAAGWPVLALGALFLFTAAVAVLARRPRLSLGLPYIGLCAVAIVWLRADSAAGRSNLIFLLLLIWASDIGAYLVGRAIGGPRLAPGISPGKTWSGAVGGLLAAVITGVVTALVLQPPVSLFGVACLTAGLGIIAQAGDLLESRIKRHFGVKDSGHLIPGHGGLLDRLDAVLATVPVAALLALLAGPGVVLWQ